MEKKIKELIDKSNSIVLLTHESPDGDAIGSVMAFFHYLTSINKTVDIVIPEVPELFNYIADINKVVDKSDKSYDLGIVLDCATKERIGQMNNEFDRCTNTLNIDHHKSNTLFGTINYVWGLEPACCQVIYYLFKNLNVELTMNVGISLMTGLLTDTNGFRNDTVNKKTFLMAADMYDYGVDIYWLYKNVLATKNKAQYELMKIVVNRLEFFADGKIAFAYITKEDMESVSAKLGDHEGLVDIGREISGVEVSIFVREDNGYKVSLRSNSKVDVSMIATRFGGGGHTMASGCKINDNLENVKKVLIEEVEKVL